MAQERMPTTVYTTFAHTHRPCTRFWTRALSASSLACSTAASQSVVASCRCVVCRAIWGQVWAFMHAETVHACLNCTPTQTRLQLTAFQATTQASNSAALSSPIHSSELLGMDSPTKAAIQVGCLAVLGTGRGPRCSHSAGCEQRSTSWCSFQEGP